jgi:hypothetical protein
MGNAWGMHKGMHGEYIGECMGNEWECIMCGESEAGGMQNDNGHLQNGLFYKMGSNTIN